MKFPGNNSPGQAMGAAVDPVPMAKARGGRTFTFKGPHMARHTCPNRYAGEGARGGCYVEIEAGCTDGMVAIDVGWSCVIVHRGEIPVTWLSELVAIATGHKGGIAGFLAEHNYGGGYALMCDPPVATKA